MDSILEPGTSEAPPVAPLPADDPPVPATGKKRGREVEKPVPKKRKVAGKQKGEKGLQTISGYFTKK